VSNRGLQRRHDDHLAGGSGLRHIGYEGAPQLQILVALERRSDEKLEER
jgi:hypothetical protein